MALKWHSPSPSPPPPPKKRTGILAASRLLALPHALVECDSSLYQLQAYPYHMIQSVGFTTDDPRGLTIHVNGRGRLFLTHPKERSDLASAIKKATENVGAGFTVGKGVKMTNWAELRRKYGSDAGNALCSFTAVKKSLRNAKGQVRDLVVTQSHFLEKDASEGGVVSMRKLEDVYSIVRRGADSRVITLEYMDGSSRTYDLDDRDSFACSLLDAAMSAGNRDVCVTEGVSDNCRLTPRGVREGEVFEKKIACACLLLGGEEAQRVALMQRALPFFFFLLRN